MKTMANNVMDRAADLHYAYQCGQEAGRGDETATQEMLQRLSDDPDATLEFNRGFSQELSRM